jgi:hypothetical protein
LEQRVRTALVDGQIAQLIEEEKGRLKIHHDSTVYKISDIYNIKMI